jgi:hypothetical protein
VEVEGRAEASPSQGGGGLVTLIDTGKRSPPAYHFRSRASLASFTTISQYYITIWAEFKRKRGFIYVDSLQAFPTHSGASTDFEKAQCFPSFQSFALCNSTLDPGQLHKIRVKYLAIYE